MPKKRKGFPKPMSFLEPSGVQHRGRTYEDFYANVNENRPVERDLPATYDPPIDFYIEPGRPHGKAAPAGVKKQRHQHDWLIRHDYMQCRSCGLLVDLAKGHGSVD